MPRPYYPVFRDHCISLVVHEYNASGFSGAGTDYEHEAMDHDRLLDRGIDSPGHYFFVIVDGEDPEVLGEIWLGHVEKMEAGSVFLFYLRIGEDFRHQGIGRVAMRLVEEKMTAAGFDTINLHVFLRNKAAISLYEKSGYSLSREYEIGRFYQKRMKKGWDMKKIDTEKGPVAVLGQNDIRIEDVGAFLDLLGAADCDTIAIVKENLDPSFFELSSGFAGELLQKVSNYRKRLIIIGNFGNVESKSLRDFIYESNRNGQVIFASDLETALTMLS